MAIIPNIKLFIENTTKKLGAKLITDDKGVTWFELDIKPEMGKAPIEAFGMIPFIGALQKKEKDYNKTTTIPFVERLKQPLFINK